jgi:hypothetical protein
MYDHESYPNPITMLTSRGEPAGGNSTYTLYNASVATWPIWGALPPAIQNFELVASDKTQIYSAWFHLGPQNVYWSAGPTMGEVLRTRLYRLPDDGRTVIQKVPTLWIFRGVLYIAYLADKGQLAVRMFDATSWYPEDAWGDAQYLTWVFSRDAIPADGTVFDNELRMFVVDGGALYCLSSNKHHDSFDPKETISTPDFTPRRVMTIGNGSTKLYILAVDDNEKVYVTEFNKFRYKTPVWTAVRPSDSDGLVIVGSSMAAKILMVWREGSVSVDYNAALYESFLET